MLIVQSSSYNLISQLPVMHKYYAGKIRPQVGAGDRSYPRHLKKRMNLAESRQVALWIFEKKMQDLKISYFTEKPHLEDKLSF